AVPSWSCGSSQRGAIAVCQASVIAPSAVELASEVASTGNCAKVAAPPASMALRVSATGLTDLRRVSCMESSLRDPRFPGGLYGLLWGERGPAAAVPEPQAMGQRVHIGQP